MVGSMYLDDNLDLRTLHGAYIRMYGEVCIFICVYIYEEGHVSIYEEGNMYSYIHEEGSVYSFTGMVGWMHLNDNLDLGDVDASYIDTCPSSYTYGNVYVYIREGRKWWYLNDNLDLGDIDAPRGHVRRYQHLHQVGSYVNHSNTPWARV